MIRMLAAAALTAVAALGAIAVAGRASAGLPTPEVTASATPGVTATPEPAYMQLDFSTDPPTLNWEAVAGATFYDLVASVSVVEVNATDPFCIPPDFPQSKQIDVAEELPGGTNTFVIPEPPCRRLTSGSQ